MQNADLSQSREFIRDHLQVVHALARGANNATLVYLIEMAIFENEGIAASDFFESSDGHPRRNPKSQKHLF